MLWEKPKLHRQKIFAVEAAGGFLQVENVGRGSSSWDIKLTAYQIIIDVRPAKDEIEKKRFETAQTICCDSKGVSDLRDCSGKGELIERADKEWPVLLHEFPGFVFSGNGPICSPELPDAGNSLRSRRRIEMIHHKAGRHFADRRPDLTCREY